VAVFPHIRTDAGFLTATLQSALAGSDRHLFDDLIRFMASLIVLSSKVRRACGC
jgi:hypothetical protein